MTETPGDYIELEEDEPPKSGKWVDPEEFLQNPTEEELEDGQRLGQEIDTQNDFDRGDITNEL